MPTFLSRTPLAAGALAMAAALSSGAAHAETIEPGQAIGEESALTSYLGSPRTFDALITPAKDLDIRLGEVCEADYALQVTNITIFKPVEIVSGSEPTEGIWRVYYNVNRCDRETRMSALAEAGAGDRVKWTFLVPGESKASDQLVLGLKEALPRASGIEGCDDVFVADTMMGGPEGVELNKPEMTHETWEVRGCGKTMDLIWRFESEEGSDEIQAVLENRIPRQ
jgi:hypothetical protein